MLKRLLGRHGASAAIAAVGLSSAMWALTRLGAGRAAAIIAAITAAAATWALTRRGPFGDRLLASWLALLRRPSSLHARARIPSLTSPVAVELDPWGIPTVNGSCRLDAVRGLGYITARDRLFQMDLLRRHSAGTLAEVVGIGGLEKDLRRRVLGLRQAAEGAASMLPPAERDLLQAYADGVNARLADVEHLPYEFLVLGYEPERWSPADSLLVLLHLFLLLCGDDQPKRMLAAMEASLPPDVVAFLTPDMDEMTPDADRLLPPRLPLDALRSLLGEIATHDELPADLVQAEALAAASNCWAVDGSRTLDGRAIVANDLHMSLGVPNFVYRACLRYTGLQLTGLLVPGVPLILAGSNGRVSWGVANLPGDCLDLIQLETDAEKPDRYRTAHGWTAFDTRREEVRFKGGGTFVADVRSTIWGPVLARPLLGRPVALRWTALQPDAVNLRLVDMDRAGTVEEALDVVEAFGGPPLSVTVADRSGRIGRTLCGRIPRRRLPPTATIRSGADADAAWDGYVAPADLPRVVDPPGGRLIAANDEGTVAGSRFPLGRGFSSGTRGRQIARRLAAMGMVTETASFLLQLDTCADHYEFYREAALRAIAGGGSRPPPEVDPALVPLLAWDGRADGDSPGLALLVAFRARLARRVLGPFLRRCRGADDGFIYRWPKLDVPLRVLLTQRPPELLPDASFATWDGFVLALLEESVKDVQSLTAETSVEGPAWGRANRSQVRHPLSRPGLCALLDMPRAPLPGCLFSINAAAPDWAAVARMVVGPGHEQEGILHMPCGQSGDPRSPHYDDQHEHWAQGAALPFLPGVAREHIRLEP